MPHLKDALAAFAGLAVALGLRAFVLAAPSSEPAPASVEEIAPTVSESAPAKPRITPLNARDPSALVMGPINHFCPPCSCRQSAVPLPQPPPPQPDERGRPRGDLAPPETF